jgi:hypothetical protein
MVGRLAAGACEDFGSAGNTVHGRPVGTDREVGVNFTDVTSDENGQIHGSSGAPYLLVLRADEAEIRAYGEGTPWTVTVDRILTREPQRICRSAFIWRVESQRQAVWLATYVGEFLSAIHPDADWRQLLPKIYREYSEHGDMLPAKWCGG